MKRRAFTRAGLLSAIVSTVLCEFSFGVPISSTAGMVQVVATQGKHTAVYTGIVPVTGFNANLNWQSPGSLTLSDGDTPLAVVKELRVSTSSPHQVDLSFALTNSSMTDFAFFSIRTATISFDGISNPEAAATAAVTLAQGAGSPAGASLTGNFEGGRVYQARYSTDETVNTSTVFATLTQGPSFASGLSADGNESFPQAGMIPLPKTCFMMESEFSFVLSPGDQASGTSAFLITPEPATLVLLVLGAAPLLRRR